MGKRITTEYYCDTCSAVVKEQDLIQLRIPELYISTPAEVPDADTLELCVTCATDYSSKIRAVLQQFLQKQEQPMSSGQGYYTGLDALELPAGAVYVAADESGAVHWYCDKPTKVQHGWLAEDVYQDTRVPGVTYTGDWRDSLLQVIKLQPTPDAPQHAELPPEAEQSHCVDVAGEDKPKAQISAALVPAFASYASKLVAELPAIKTAQQYQGTIDADKYTDMFAPAIAKKLMQLADRPDWSHYCVVCSTGDAYWLSSLNKDSAEFKLMHIGSGFCTFDWSSSLVTDLPAFKYDIESCESRINYVAINASGSLMGFIDRPCFQPTGVWSAPSRLCEIPDFGMFDARYCDSSLRRVVRDGRPRALRVRDAAKLDVTKLKPPAEARWVAVDESGRAWYYTSKPHVEENGWTCGDDGELLTMEPGVFDTSNWQEEVHPVNLEQGS